MAERTQPQLTSGRLLAGGSSGFNGSDVQVLISEQVLEQLEEESFTSGIWWAVREMLRAGLAPSSPPHHLRQTPT